MKTANHPSRGAGLLKLAVPGISLLVGLVIGALITKPEAVGLTSSQPAPVLPALRAEAPSGELEDVRASLRARNIQLAQERRARLDSERQLREVEDALLALSDEAAPLLADPARRPIPFPESPEEGFAPPAFEDIARRVTAECGMGLAIEALDCSEYPCTAWFRGEDPSIQRYSMESCAAWKDHFSQTLTTVSEVEIDGVPTRLLGFMPLPPEADLQRPVGQRRGERHRAMITTYGPADP